MLLLLWGEVEGIRMCDARRSSLTSTSAHSLARAENDRVLYACMISEFTSVRV